MKSLEIPTALSETEAFRLQEMARGKIVLEVGSLLGYSTVRLAEVAERVYAVDPHAGYPERAPKDTLIPFLENLTRYGVGGRVVPLIGKAQEVLPILRPIFEFAFIDVSGKFEDSWYCLNEVNGLLVPGGWMAIHDMGVTTPFDCSGATTAAHNFIKVRGEGPSFACETTLFMRAK